MDEAPQAVPVSRWRYLPPPEGPDPVPESAHLERDAPAGFRVLAARVRGKKHRHDGSHGDDWFAADSSGPWSVLAVADGAGSKPLSRVGARVATEAAVASLAEALAERRPALAETDLADFFRRDPSSGQFQSAALEDLQQALHAAVRAGHAAILQAAADRNAGTAVPIRPNDLACTLLMAAHTLVEVGGRPASLVLTCQLGDGMAAALDESGKVLMLGAADSGEYAGETEFLTSAERLTPPQLAARTFVALIPLRALFLMTDGVADDYFPADPGLIRLYADLVLNRILDADAPPGRLDEEAARALAGSECVASQGVLPRENVRTAAGVAEVLGVTAEELARSPELLAAAAAVPLPWPAAGASERLRLWLDSYQVRGSFDDRTLLILHRGPLP